MKKSLQDKVVIVTGASSGIGKACAAEFSARGAKVVMAARNLDKLNAISQSLSTENIAVMADVSREDDCRKLIEAAIEKFGRIDILINNAGISMRALFKDVELEVLHQLMNTNFWGTVYCTKYALPHIMESKGSIAGISSIAGFRGLPGRSGYSASKFAMHGFLETIRTELLHDDVHVMIACPGFTKSNIRNVALNSEGKHQGESPLNEEKQMSPEAVAKYIADGIEKRKRTLILTQQGKLTVFFNKWLPKWMDRMVYNHFAKEPDSPLKK